MPITNAPSSTTSAAPMPLPPIAGGQGNGGMNFNLPQFQFQGTPQNLPVNFTGIQQLLQQNPQSMTNSLMPGLMQILGLQTNSMLPMFQNQTASNVASAQSDMMKRGLTGSSLEASSMLGARQAGDYNMNQFMGQQLGQAGQAYTGAIGQDVTAQNQMYQNLAQAIGQEYANRIQQEQFNRMLQENMAEAGRQHLERQQGQIMSAVTGMGAGTMMGAGSAGGFGRLFSDDILKHDVRKVDEIGGLGIYQFSYRTDDFPSLDLPRGRKIGVMAQEVAKRFPQFVRSVRGFLMVDYGGLFKAMEAQYA